MLKPDISWPWSFLLSATGAERAQNVDHAYLLARVRAARKHHRLAVHVLERHEIRAVVSARHERDAAGGMAGPCDRVRMVLDFLRHGRDREGIGARRLCRAACQERRADEQVREGMGHL